MQQAAMSDDQERRRRHASMSLLAWYDRHRRVLPWRAPAHDIADPYRVWLSEIMLQQTVVKAVIPYFDSFTRRWPTLADLAAAPEDEVMAAWAGLGYYSRARKLIACAKEVMERFDGRFPDDEAALLALPGIGPYTAAAITAIAFGRRAVVVDGNVERVIARLFRITTPLPAAKREIRQRAAELAPARRPGDYAQGMMDLGATICTPRRPACDRCPLMAMCEGGQAGDAEDFPRKIPKRAKPQRRGLVYVAFRGGDVLLTRRPPRGLLGGMVAFPSTPWGQAASGDAQPMAGLAPVARGKWHEVAGDVTHVFTHFTLSLTIWIAQVDGDTIAPADMWWSPASQLEEAGLPTLMQKVARHPQLVSWLRRQSVT